MDTVTSEVTTRELRGQLADVLGRAMYAGERIGVTRNGKLAAVVIGVGDLEALEEFEMAQDLAGRCRGEFDPVGHCVRPRRSSSRVTRAPSSAAFASR